MSEQVEIRVDGHPLRVPAGVSVAAALAGAGRLDLRRSLDGSPRGFLCGVGICFECRVTLDGRAHVRACMQVCREGLRVETGRG